MSTEKSLSLYHLSTEMQNLMARLFDPETGEIDEAVDAELNATTQTANAKCLAVASVIKRLEAEQALLQHYYQEVTSRQIAYQKELGKLENYLHKNMIACKITEIKHSMFTIKIKTNPYSTNVYDESQLDPQFMVTREIVKTETKPDKEAIKRYVLGTGMQVPGAHVEQKTKLIITTEKL